MKNRLHYQDFTPLYSQGKRTNSYVSPSTGEVISKRQFQQGAHGGLTLEKRAARNKTVHDPQSPNKNKSTAPEKKTPLFQPLVTNGKRDKKYRYVNPTTGQVISKSTYYRKYREKQPPSSTGDSTPPSVSPSSIDTARPNDSFIQEHKQRVNNSRENILKTYTDKLNRDARIYGLPLITEKEAAKQAEFKFILKALKTKDNSAKGKKAQALVLLGLRDADWTNDVGNSP